jgi:hypothetical protein
VFVDDLDLSGLGFKTVAEVTGRPGYHPATCSSTVISTACSHLVAWSAKPSAMSS